jgi:hypothetical protein
MAIQDKTIMNLVAKYCSAFFKNSSVVEQNCQKAHFPCPPPPPPPPQDSREFGKYKGNGNGNMVINNSINTQRQTRM